MCINLRYFEDIIDSNMKLVHTNLMGISDRTVLLIIGYNMRLVNR